MNSHGHIDSSSKIRRLIVLFAVHMFMTAYNVIYMRADNRRGADYLRSTYWEDVVSDTSLPYYLFTYFRNRQSSEAWKSRLTRAYETKSQTPVRRTDVLTECGNI